MNNNETIKEEHHSHLKYSFVKLGVFVLLAIFVFIFREHLVEHLRYFIGSLMILYALEEMLFEIIHAKKNFLKQHKVYLGFVELVLGICLITVNLSIESTCIIWATWSILREAYEVEEIVSELHNIVPKIISGAESLAAIVFSILLIVEPGEHHAMIHIYLLLVELVVTPLTPILDELLSKNKKALHE